MGKLRSKSLLRYDITLEMSIPQTLINIFQLFLASTATTEIIVQVEMATSKTWAM